MARPTAFYKILKWFLRIKSKRLKVMMLLTAHRIGRRYIGVYIDPVVACNLRCRMCYFSEKATRPAPGRPMTAEQLDAIAKAFFSRALKVQIGCGAEPTVYASLDQLVERARRAGVPEISITTNGQLLTTESLGRLADCGLNSLTLSLHGTTAPTYEYFMQGAKFDRLKTALQAIAEVQKRVPKFALRMNYTMNHANFREVAGLFDLLGDARLDVLQLRPIQNLGDTSFHDFELDDIINAYDEVIEPLRRRCEQQGVTLLAPTRENLHSVDDVRPAIDAIVEDICYCFISNSYTYMPDFDIARDTFNSYWKRHHLLRRLAELAIKGVPKETHSIITTKRLNYTVALA